MAENLFFNPLFLVLLSSNALYPPDQTKVENILFPKLEQPKEVLEEHHIEVKLFIQEP